MGLPVSGDSLAFLIIERFGLNRRGVGDDALGCRINFQYSAAAGTGYIES